MYRNSDTSQQSRCQESGRRIRARHQCQRRLRGRQDAKKADAGPVSRGYREEIEHWAYCIRNPDGENRPRCHPEVAMGDAVIALGANLALKKSQKGEPGFLKYEEEWFEIDNDATPDGSDIKTELGDMKKPVA